MQGHFNQKLDDAVAWLRLPAELIQRIAAFLAQLAPNDVPCVLRLLNKNTAAALRGPEHTTVHLSQPVPVHAFAHKWTQPDAVRPLNLQEREQLRDLTAKSGVVPNLEVAVRVAGLRLDRGVLHAAAEAGHLAACEWLREQGLAWNSDVMKAAAKGGQLQLCRQLRAEGCRVPCGLYDVACGNTQLVEWLLGEGCTADMYDAEAAAREGHAAAVHLLLSRLGEDGDAEDREDLRPLVEWSALGLDLPDFAQVLSWCEQQQQQPPAGDGAAAVSAQVKLLRAALGFAVLSPTPDWEDKVAWVLAEWGRLPRAAGPPALPRRWVSDMAARTASAHPEVVQRLEWMCDRGLLTPQRKRYALSAFARSGHAHLITALLDSGAAAAAGAAQSIAWAASHAAERGDLGVLQVLHARGCHFVTDGETYLDVFAQAVKGRQLAVLQWLEATLYPQGLPPPGQHPLVPATFAAAVASGSLPVMRWLAERGCPCDESCWQDVGAASVEAVEWLASHGCPFPDDGRPYISAGQHADQPMLAALRRLGCPWTAGTFTEAARAGLEVRVLRWMAEQRCPVDLQAAWRAAASRYFGLEVHALLLQLRDEGVIAWADSSDWDEYESAQGEEQEEEDEWEEEEADSEDEEGGEEEGGPDWQ